MAAPPPLSLSALLDFSSNFVSLSLPALWNRARDFAQSIPRIKFTTRESCKITNASDVEMELAVCAHFGDDGYSTREVIPIPSNNSKDIYCDDYDLRDRNPRMRLIFHVKPPRGVADVGEKLIYLYDLKTNDGIKITYMGAPAPVVKLDFTPRT